MSKNVLVIEDDSDLLDYLREILSDRRFVVHTASSGSRARKLFAKVMPDMVLLDLHLPDISGESLISEFKKLLPTVQIIVLTADNDAGSVVKNLKEGADDYVSKPFNSEELFARIQARLRDPGSSTNKLTAGNLVVDTQKMEVKYNQKFIDLSHTEFELLRYLMENKDRVLTREMILSKVWSTDPDVETRVVDVYIGYLRKKIGTDLIKSKRGYGYAIAEK